MTTAIPNFKCGANAEDDEAFFDEIDNRTKDVDTCADEDEVDFDIVSDEEFQRFLDIAKSNGSWEAEDIANLAGAFANDPQRRDYLAVTGRDRLDFVAFVSASGGRDFETYAGARERVLCIRNEDGSVKSGEEQAAAFSALRGDTRPTRLAETTNNVSREQPSLDTMLADLIGQKQPALRGVTSAAELDGPDRALPEFLIEQLILEGFVNALWGDGFVGKTTLAIYMAVAIAAGVPLFGRAVKKRPVLLVLAEDPIAVVQRRLRIVCEQLGVRLSDLRLKVVTQPDDGEMIDFCLGAIDNKGHYEPRPYLGQLSQLIAAAQGDPVFVVLDTASQFAELDEDERLAVTTFTQKILGAICHKYKATILLTAHPSAAQMRSGRNTSGSTAWRNSVRNMLMLQKSGDSRRRLTSLSNFIRGADIALSYQDGVFELDDGKAASPSVTEETSVVSPLMASCVALAIELADKGTPAKRPRGPAGYKEMPPAFYARRKILFGTATPRARAVWDALDGAVDAGYLDYRPTTKHSAAGYFKGPRAIGEPAVW